jgi:hypothetical protein
MTDYVCNLYSLFEEYICEINRNQEQCNNEDCEECVCNLCKYSVKRSAYIHRVSFVMKEKEICPRQVYIE